jgi:hypothetical protein
MPPRLLDEAEKLFARQEYRDTYGLIAHVARVYLSYETGDRREKSRIYCFYIKPADPVGTKKTMQKIVKNCEKMPTAACSARKKQRKEGLLGLAGSAITLPYSSGERGYRSRV